MSARVVAEVDRTGRLVARKRSRDRLDAVRLRHEAEVLTSARHPGVVEIVDCVDGEDQVELTTAYLGSHSLATLPPVGVERAAGIVAALAETLADLHDIGLVHGRIEPSHVLVGPGGRPVLCGFAGGGRIGTAPPPGSAATTGYTDPAATDGAALAAESDVYGLGVLLRGLIDGMNEAEPIPERRISISRLRPRWSGYQRRALLTLADQATDDAPLRRPPARRLAADILGTVPAATITADDDPFSALRSSTDDADTPRSRRGRIVVLASIAIACGSLLLVSAATRESGSAAAASPPAVTNATATIGSTVMTPRTTVGADGEVVVEGKHYTVGEPGDQITIGDWDCNGTTTLALLRPRTGAVFVFDSWATAAGDVSTSPTTIVEGAIAFDVRNDGFCPSLFVLRSDGSERAVTL